MRFDVHWLDVNPFLTQHRQPMFALRRELAHGSEAKGGLFNVAEVARSGTYYVPTSDLNKEQIEFSLVKSGEYVRIPIHAYRTTERALATILGTAIQLGISARDGLARQYQVEVEHTVLVLGHEVHDLLQNGFRCYAGLAFKIKG